MIILIDCEADNNDEISFRQGDIILIVNERTGVLNESTIN